MYIGYKSVLIVLGDVDLCISSKNAIVQVKMEGERSWKSFRNRVYKIEVINTLELFHILSTRCSQENVNKRRKNFNWYLTFYG